MILVCQADFSAQDLNPSPPETAQPAPVPAEDLYQCQGT
jgi:hypothetical protein